MNMLNALFFPNTKPTPEVAEKALCLLDSITCYQLIEDEPGKNELPEGCIPRVPVPLGADKERFSRMVKDLRINQADYYSGLIASLSSASRDDRDESSVWNLISRLHRKNGVVEQRFKDKLFQARLVLSLADILDQEIRSVDSGLSDVRRKEQELFKALHGEFADSGDLTEVQSKREMSSPGNQVADEIMMTAWGTLYALDEKDYGMLLTECQSCAGLLFDIWSDKADAEPVKIVEVGLPAEGDMKGVEEFSGTRKNLMAMISRVAAEGSLEQLSGAASAYQKIIMDYGIETGFSLEMYLLSGYSAKDTFADISNVRSVSAGHDPFLVGIVKTC